MKKQKYNHEKTNKSKGEKSTATTKFIVTQKFIGSKPLRELLLNLMIKDIKNQKAS